MMVLLLQVSKATAFDNLGWIVKLKAEIKETL